MCARRSAENPTRFREQVAVARRRQLEASSCPTASPLPLAVASGGGASPIAAMVIGGDAAVAVLLVALVFLYLRKKRMGVLQSSAAFNAVGLTASGKGEGMERGGGAPVPKGPTTTSKGTQILVKLTGKRGQSKSPRTTLLPRASPRIIFILASLASAANACICPGQFYKCRTDGWCERPSTDLRGHDEGCTSAFQPFQWCSDFCGMWDGGDCTQDFVPLVAASNSWSLAHVLTTHWNDEAANMLEQFAIMLAYEENADALRTWNCEKMISKGVYACLKESSGLDPYPIAWEANVLTPRI